MAEATTLRLSKDGHKNIDKIKKIMKSMNMPDSAITRSSAIEFALAETAKGKQNG